MSNIRYLLRPRPDGSIDIQVGDEVVHTVNPRLSMMIAQAVIASHQVDLAYLERVQQ